MDLMVQMQGWWIWWWIGRERGTQYLNAVQTHSNPTNKDILVSYGSNGTLEVEAAKMVNQNGMVELCSSPIAGPYHLVAVVADTKGEVGSLAVDWRWIRNLEASCGFWLDQDLVLS